MKKLTVKELNNACKEHRYILARFSSGYLMGINTLVAKIAQKKRKEPDNQETDFIGWFPCDFNTYITHKHPFITK